MIDIDSKIPGAEGFKYKEFIYSSIAIRNGIDNTPEEWQWGNIELLAVNVLQPLRDKFGRIRITSGFRSEALNGFIKGSKTSNHCKGEAADIEPVDENIKLFDIIEFVHDNLEFRTLILEFPPTGWIHVDFRKGANSRKLQIKDATHNYDEVTIDYLRRNYNV